MLVVGAQRHALPEGVVELVPQHAEDPGLVLHTEARLRRVRVVVGSGQDAVARGVFSKTSQTVSIPNAMTKRQALDSLLPTIIHSSVWNATPWSMCGTVYGSARCCELRMLQMLAENRYGSPPSHQTTRAMAPSARAVDRGAG